MEYDASRLDLGDCKVIVACERYIIARIVDGDISAFLYLLWLVLRIKASASSHSDFHVLLIETSPGMVRPEKHWPCCR